MHIFERAVIHTNLGKTKSITCTPVFIWGHLGKDAYKRWDTGKITTFREREQVRVICDECGITMTDSSLSNYKEIIHGRILAHTWEVETRGGGRDTCVVSFH